MAEIATGQQRGIRVTATDLETGETSTAEIQPGNYVLVCADPCQLAGIEASKGKRVLTLKGYGPGGNPYAADDMYPERAGNRLTP
jgi:hypothetical protein